MFYRVKDFGLRGMKHSKNCLVRISLLLRSNRWKAQKLDRVIIPMGSAKNSYQRENHGDSETEVGTESCFGHC